MRNRFIVFLLLIAPSLVLAQAPPANLYPMQEGFVDSHGALIYYKAVATVRR